MRKSKLSTKLLSVLLSLTLLVGLMSVPAFAESDSTEAAETAVVQPAQNEEDGAPAEEDAAAPADDADDAAGDEPTEEETVGGAQTPADENAADGEEEPAEASEDADLSAGGGQLYPMTRMPIQCP